MGGVTPCWIVRNAFVPEDEERVDEATIVRVYHFEVKGVGGSGRVA